ncbi:MAG: ABC transporter substrate-binding protein [Actinomycetota bacterium]
MALSKRMLGVLAAGAVLLAGCSDGDSSSTDASSANTAELKIFGWGDDTEVKAFEARVAAFTAQTGIKARFYPNPQDTFDAVTQTAISGGKAPDVMYVDTSKVKTYVASDLLAPVPDGAIEQPEGLVKSLADSFVVDGKSYAVAKDFATLGLIYNTELFKEAGISRPPTTWEEFADTAKKLTKKGRVGLALDPQYARVGPFLQSNGAQLLDSEDKLAINSPETTAALEYLQSLYASGSAATPKNLDAGWEGEAFGQQKAAMTITGNWITGAMSSTYPNVKWASAPLPQGSAGPGNFVFSAGLGVPKGSKNQENAWKFVNFFTNSAGSEAWTKDSQFAPPRTDQGDVWAKAKPERAAFFAGAEGAATYALPAKFAEVEKAMNDALTQLVSGDSKPADVIKAVETAGVDFAR